MAVSVPITNEFPSYSMNLVIDNKTYFFKFRFNPRMDRWVMEVYESDAVTPVYCGIPLLVRCPLVLRYKSESVRGEFFLSNNISEFEEIGRVEFGNTSELLYFSEDEL